MHSLHGQNVFLTSCGLKSRIIQDCSINRSCEDVRLETVLPDEYPKVFFFSTFQRQGFRIAARGLENRVCTWAEDSASAPLEKVVKK